MGTPANNDKVELMLQNHKVLNSVYMPVYALLFFYCVIGIIESLIRIFSGDFTFGNFIRYKYLSSKKDKELKEEGRLPGQLDLDSIFPQIKQSNEYEYIYNQCKNGEEKEQFKNDWNRYLLDLQSCTYRILDKKPDYDKNELYFSFDVWYRRNQIWRTSDYYHAYYEEQREKRSDTFHQNNIAKNEAEAVSAAYLNREENNDNSTYIYCEDYIGVFSKKEDIFDSDMERKVYKFLRSFINNEYIIVPHVAFREIFSWEWKMNWKLTNIVTKLHFDFGIYDSNLCPVLLIEVQGKKHYDDPGSMERDKFKAKLLDNKGVKLVAIDVSKNVEDKEIGDIVIQSIKNAVPDRNSYPVYCPKCFSQMKIRQNKITKEYFYGCSKYKHDGTGCPGVRNILSVPSLYMNMPDKLE